MIRIGVGVLLRERWRIDALVGQGGLATVWAATHERNGSRVAIKILRPDWVGDGYIRERFAREARLANRIKHPAVVRVIDDDELPDGTPIIVMELLVGETLEERRARAGGALPLGEVLGYMRTVLEALEVAHGAGVVHRDMKPDNLFLENDGRLRVLDFGIARVREGSEHATQSGTVLGTLDYMPPEQAAGRSNEVDARSDLYSLAATVFKLITGQPVHVASGIAELMMVAMSRPARSLAEAGPGLPKELVRIIDRALRFDPRERWPSAAEMKHALASFAPRDSPRLVDLAHDMTVDAPTLRRDEGMDDLDDEATHHIPDKRPFLAPYGGKVPKPPPAPTPPRSTPSSTPAARRNTPSSLPAARGWSSRNTPAATRGSAPVSIPPPPPRRSRPLMPEPEPQMPSAVAHLADAYPGQAMDSYPAAISDSYPGMVEPYPTPGRVRLPPPVAESIPPPAVRFIQDPPKKKGRALSIFIGLLIAMMTFSGTVYFTRGGRLAWPPTWPLK